ncbi:flagellar FlbD family protein [Coprothermobacter platensis]|uniref:flagellar FlbD family protein n=1 Tax=Coprothermobacter platensis TaxID=108819 RepID=UPI0003742CE7|nr:flagellar FlbD family protein [Coprothermobacter platensis]
MIKLTSPKDEEFYLNEDLIEKAEEHGEFTVLFLMNGHKYLCKESMSEIIKLISRYKNMEKDQWT